MICPNHPAVEATSACDFCGTLLCSSCLVALGGRATCETCKPHAVRGLDRPRPAPGGGDRAIRWIVPIGGNYLAVAARWCAIFGLLCFPAGALLGPVAFFLGVAAWRAAPRFEGEGRASAVLAMVVGSLALAVSLLFLGGAIFGR